MYNSGLTTKINSLQFFSFYLPSCPYNMFFYITLMLITNGKQPQFYL